MDFTDEIVDMMHANQANWDARTPVHAASAFYGDRDSSFWFAPFEWDILGDLRHRDLVHLQCHLGTETLDFARRGARTVGLDFSEGSVRAARQIAARANVEIDYVCANVYDAATALGGRRFDVVYTGKGALCYLPDLAKWAEVVTALLKPGGLLYVVEFHPVLNSLGPTPRAEDSELVLRNDYLGGRGEQRRDSAHTYTDGPDLTEATTAYEWRHGLGDVVTALVGSGLQITALHETDLLPWQRWRHMTQADNGWWRLPDDAPKIPLLYGLAATMSQSRTATMSQSRNTDAT